MFLKLIFTANKKDEPKHLLDFRFTKIYMRTEK